jgi:hypothetical protein
VSLSDARLDLVEAVIVGRKDSEGGEDEQQIESVTRLYVPIRSESSSEDERVSLLLDTQDDGLLAKANEFNQLSAVDQLVYFAEHSEDLVVKGALSGRVKGSATMSASRREQIRKLKTDLAEEFFVLDHNSAPSIGRGVSALVIGLLLLLLSLKLISRRRAAARRARSEAPGGGG